MNMKQHVRKQGRKRPQICIKCNNRGTFEERKREREKKRERERDSFGILYTDYLLSTVNIKREIERERKREREQKRERKERERERKGKKRKRAANNIKCDKKVDKKFDLR